MGPDRVSFKTSSVPGRWPVSSCDCDWLYNPGRRHNNTGPGHGTGNMPPGSSGGKPPHSHVTTTRLLVISADSLVTHCQENATVYSLFCLL